MSLRPRTARLASRVLAMLLTMAFAFGGVGFALGNWWIDRAARPYLHDAIDDVPVRDVAIVPGVGTATGHMPRHLKDRIASALALYRAHKVKAILVSGIGEPPTHDEVETMVTWLRLRGVPAERILSDPAGYRTLDTMQRATRLLNVKSAVVCTQPVFVARAVFLARAAGIDAVGFSGPTKIRPDGRLMRLEASKSALAFFDTYLLRRGPIYADPHGARIGGVPVGGGAQPVALSFLTSAISAGTAVSHVATSP